MIALLVAASSIVARAGLKATLEEVCECTVIGGVEPSVLVERTVELHPDAVVWQLSQHDDVTKVCSAIPDTPVVLLTDRNAPDLIRSGARGVLPLEVSGEQIGAAAHAAVLHMVVTMPSSRVPVERTSSVVLTPREREVLQMIGGGLANKEIAFQLGISEHTVKFHVSALLGKLGAGTRAEAIRIGIAQGAIFV